MTAKIKLKLTVMTTDAPSQYYTHEDVEYLGFKHPNDFDEQVVAASFRAYVEDQIFPIRVWLRKSDFAEADWYMALRSKALDAVTQLSAAAGSI